MNSNNEHVISGNKINKSKQEEAENCMKYLFTKKKHIGALCGRESQAYSLYCRFHS